MDGTRDPEWRPDVETVRWCFEVVDEYAVGLNLIEQLGWRPQELRQPDVAKIGEAAAEATLFQLFDIAQRVNGERPN